MFPTLKTPTINPSLAFRPRLNFIEIGGGSGGDGGGFGGGDFGGGGTFGGGGLIWDRPGTIGLGGGNGPGDTGGGGGTATSVGYTGGGVIGRVLSSVLGLPAINWGRLAAFVLGLILIVGGLYLLKPTQEIVIKPIKRAARAAGEGLASGAAAA